MVERQGAPAVFESAVLQPCSVRTSHVDGELGVNDGEATLAPAWLHQGQASGAGQVLFMASAYVTGTLVKPSLLLINGFQESCCTTSSGPCLCCRARNSTPASTTPPGASRTVDGAGRNVAIAGRAAEVGWALVLEKRLARATVLAAAALLVAGMGSASGVRTGIVCCLVGTAPGKAACMSLYHVYYTAAPVFAEWVGCPF